MSGTLSRSYVVGLPVVITVSADGMVTYEVDTSEASCAVSDALWNMDVVPDEDDIQRDMAAIDADHARRHSA